RQLLHLRRIGAARVQHGAAAPVDGARIFLVERHHVARHAGRVLDIEVGEGLPAAAQAEHVDLVVARPIGHALDDAIEAGPIAAAGENTDALSRHGIAFRMGTHATHALTHAVDESTPASPRHALITNNAPATLWFPSRFAVRSGQ